mgnify:CR=1 FL=1
MADKSGQALQSTAVEPADLAACRQAIRPGCEIDPVLLRMAKLFDKRGWLEVRIDEVLRAGQISKNTYYRLGRIRGILEGIRSSFARHFALHVAALDGRRDEPAMRWMCGNVGPGGRGPASITGWCCSRCSVSVTSTVRSRGWRLPPATRRGSGRAGGHRRRCRPRS